MTERLAKGIAGEAIVITGGYGGIGLAVAQLVAELGGKAVIAGRNRSKGETAAAAIRAKGLIAHFVEMDVADPASVEAAAEAIDRDIGPVSGLVANAAATWPGPAFDLSPEDWRKTLAVNLDGTFFCAQAFGRRMRGRGGSIVIVSSAAAAKVTWPPAVLSYSVAKAGISHLARLLGVEWASENIRVNAVEPGHIDTQMTRNAQQRRPELIEGWISMVPQKRLIDADEIADTIGFLLSDLSSSMTASVISADGGYTKR